jgi:hypothetical protein
MNDFNLPKISEELDKEEFDYRNKYRNIYIRLIIRCQNMTDQELSGYNEKHHILPKCLGGDNTKSNIVVMPVRYHIMAHIVLTKAFPEYPGLRYALLLITSEGTKNNQAKRTSFGLKTFSTRTLAKVREEATEKLKELGRSEEHCRKLSEAAKGRKLSEEQKRKISESGRGLKRSEETRRRISQAQIGKVVKQSTRDKVSKGHKDKFGRKVVGPDGKIYETIATAARANNIPPTTLIAWLKIRKDNHGWKFYEDNDPQSD